MPEKEKEKAKRPKVIYDKSTMVPLIKGYSRYNWVTTGDSEAYVEEFMSCIEDLAEKNKSIKMVYIWDNCVGLYQVEDVKKIKDALSEQPKTPQTAEKAFRTFLNNNQLYSALLIKDANLIEDPIFWRLVIDAYEKIAEDGKRIYFLSPFSNYPSEFTRYLNLYKHKLPSYASRRLQVDMVDNFLQEEGDKEGIKFTRELKDEIAKVTAGLYLMEIKDAIFRSLVTDKDNKVLIEHIITHKEEIVEKTSKIKFMRETDTFNDIGGMENLKKYVINRFNEKKKHLPRSGVILVGLPGTGKTLFANALGNYLNLPTIYFDFSNIFNKLVGDSEKAMKNALDVLDVVGEGVMVLDEMEKAIGGVQSSNRTDGGTANRVFEYFLRWLNRKDRKIYVIATSNNIDELPPEFVRAGRWDNVFFVDYPNEVEAKEIFQKKCVRYQLSNWEDHYNYIKKDKLENMTGAEIEQMVLEFAYLDSKDYPTEKGMWDRAYELVPRLFDLQQEKVKKLRNEVGVKYISASLKTEFSKNNGISSTEITKEGNILKK